MAIKSVKKAKRRIFVYYLGVFVILLLLVLTLPNYLFQIYTKNKELKDYQSELVELQKQEDELHTEVLQLQDPEYIAMIARQKYLFSKDGEWIIKIDKVKTETTNEEDVIDFWYYMKWTGIIVIGILIIIFVLVLIKRILKHHSKGKHSEK